LLGGAGNDVLIGGGGHDVIDGGTGTDTAVFFGTPTDYQAALHTHPTTGQHELWVRHTLTGDIDTVRHVEVIKIGSVLYEILPGHPQPPDDVYAPLSTYLSPSSQDLTLIGVVV
jgi:hypothetical protein